MDVFTGLHERVLAAVEQLKHDGVVPHEASLAGVTLEPPKEAGMAISPPMPRWCWPRPPARRRARSPSVSSPLIASIRMSTKVEIAGPGFINLTLSSAFWPTVLRMVLELGASYGNSAIGKGEAVNVEYVSANPTGPMHVGHCRGAVFGDALASLLAFAGFAVTREYYVNDAGAQVDALARSAYLRYREALGETIGEIPEGLYPGDYLAPSARSSPSSTATSFSTMPRERLAPHRAGRRARIDAGHDRGGSRAARHPPRRVLLRALAERGRATRSPRPSPSSKAKGLIYRGACRRPRARSTRIGRTASSFCSARPRSATTSTGRWSSPMAHTRISQATWPITATSSDAALTL